MSNIFFSVKVWFGRSDTLSRKLTISKFIRVATHFTAKPVDSQKQYTMGRLCVFNPPPPPRFVYRCMWLIVMLWALIYRWAGGGAEEDVHEMDQFPLGQGKRVLLIPIGHCQPLCCPLYTNRSAALCVVLKTPPHLDAFPLFNHAAASTVPPCDICSKTHCGAGHGTESAS